MSKIEWTETTWNPVTGCTKVSAGCEHCYAERMAKRLRAMGQPRYRNGFRVTCHANTLTLPQQWRNPRLVFVNSMSDLFHEDVPDDFIAKVFASMSLASHHDFQVLTKRARRLESLATKLSWPANVWIGVSVENADYVWRIDCLRKIPARIRFLSLEPLLGPLPELKLDGVTWAIVGGESGPAARPISEQWVLSIKRQCRHAGTSFFFKQWGGTNKKKTGRLLRGHIYDEMPVRPSVVNRQKRVQPYLVRNPGPEDLLLPFLA